MIRAVYLWLLGLRISILEGEISHGEVSVREQRASLQHAYRTRHRLLCKVGQLTPAHRLLRDIDRRKARHACQS